MGKCSSSKFLSHRGVVERHALSGFGVQASRRMPWGPAVCPGKQGPAVLEGPGSLESRLGSLGLRDLVPLTLGTSLLAIAPRPAPLHATLPSLTGTTRGFLPLT